MSARPWLKWYPSDWRADPLVRACEPITRYVWMEMLGLMHEAEPYGHLVLGGRAMDYKTLSRVIAVDAGEVKRAVKELEDRGVFSRTDDGVIVSRRMIRDENRRKTLQENGKKGGNPFVRNQGLSQSLVNQEDNQPVKPHIPESRIQIDSSLRSESKKETSASALAKKADSQPSPRPRKQAHRWPEDFALSDDMRRFAEERVPGIDCDAEFVRFRDWAIANGRTYIDWQAAWRTRIQNPYPKAMRPHATDRFADSPTLQGTARFLARQNHIESDDDVSIFTRRRNALAH